MTDETELKERYFWTEEDVKALPPLPEPAEIFDIPPEKKVVLRVERWGLYQYLIHPRPPRPTEPKLIPVLRVWMQKGYEGPRASYWDITSKHLISILYPFLTRKDFRSFELEIVKRGVAPKSYFEVTPRKVE